MRTEQIKEYLEYRFTDSELLGLSKTMARANQDLAALEGRMKQVAADFKAQISKEEAVLSDLSRKVNNGYEYRDIDCEVRFHDPVVGKKTTVRLDSMEIVRVATMTGAEMQENLFDQQPDEEVATHVGAADSNSDL